MHIIVLNIVTIRGYRPKCVSVLVREALCRRACRWFECARRDFRGRPECVSGTGRGALCRKASRVFECRLFDWSYEDTQMHAMRRRDEEERHDVGGAHPMAV